MALCNLAFFAKEIGKQCQMNVIVPEEGTGPFPVWYLLHGLSDDYSIWLRRTSIERYVSNLPLIVAMPDGFRGVYCDAVNGPASERDMQNDVLGSVERLFPAAAKGEGRVIGGLSMGGYGSMKLALKFPGLFCSVASHSSAFDIAKRDWGERAAEVDLIFGKDATGGKDDLFAIAGKAERAKLPAIRFDCGAEDFLIDDNRRFHAHLEQLGIAHEYAEFPGMHNWDYWDVHVQEALAFHRRALNL